MGVVSGSERGCELTPEEKIRRRHIGKLLSDLEQIGNVTEADKSIIKFHVQNMVDDLMQVKVEGNEDENRFNR